MNENDAHQTRPVLACLDGTDNGDRAMRYAIADAARRDTGIRLLHVLEPPSLAVGPTGLYQVPTARDIGGHILKDALKRCFEIAPDLYVEGSLRAGSRAASIAEETHTAASAVLGTRQVGAMRFLGGSTSTGVAARAACPVIVVPPSWDRTEVRHLVAVGVDETAGPEPVLEAAFDEASRREAELVVVHAWQAAQPYGYDGAWLDPTAWIGAAQSRLAAAVSPTAARHPDVPVRYVVRFESPRVTLPAVAAECDVLVLGRHLGGLSLVHHLGSIARHAIHAGVSPVMVVPMSSDSR